MKTQVYIHRVIQWVLNLKGAAGEAPLLMSIAGRTAPTVLHVNGRQSGSYIDREFLIPLDDFIRPDQTIEEAKNNGTYDSNIMYKNEFDSVVNLKYVMLYIVKDQMVKNMFIFYHIVTARVLAYNKTLFLNLVLILKRIIQNLGMSYLTLLENYKIQIEIHTEYLLILLKEQVGLHYHYFIQWVFM